MTSVNPIWKGPFFPLPVLLRDWSRSGGERVCKGSRVMSQTGCAGAMERSGWGTLTKLAGWEAELQERRGSWGGGQSKAHPTTGDAGNSRGGLGLLVEGRAVLGGLDKEESTANTENMYPSYLELM